MDKKTVNMFVNTCGYLNYIMDEIMASNMEVPHDTILSVNELMSKLFSFMNHMHRNSLTPPLPGSIVDADKCVINSYPQMNFTPAQKAGGQTSSPVILEGTPVSHYGVPTSGRVSGPPNFDPPKQSSISVPTQSGYELLQKAAANVVDNSVQASKSLKKAKDKVVPSPIQTLVPGNKESQSTADVNVKEKLGGDVYITKLYCCYTDGILNGEITAANIGVYCRVCDSICIGQWADHIAEEHHIVKCSEYKKLKMYACCLCKLTIYGSKNLVLKYFEYHFRKIHEGKNQLSWEEALIEVHSADSQNGSNYSSNSSLNVELSTKKKKPRKKNKVNVNKVNANKGLTTDDQSSGSTSSASKTESSVPIAKNINEFFSKGVKTDSALAKNANGAFQTTTSVPVVKNNNDGDQNSLFVKSAQNNDGLQNNKSVQGAKNNGGAQNTHSVKSAKSNSGGDQNASSAKSVKKAPPTTPVSKVPHNTPATTPNKNSPTKASVAPPTSKISDDILSPSQYPFFDSVLHEMLVMWRQKSIHISAGFCDVCQVGKLSAFDWFSHVEDHEKQNPSKWSELICPRCNIKIYGKNHSKYFNSPYHCKVDKIFTES